MATLRETLEAGRPTVGGWCSIPSPFAAELMGRCEYDWVCIDTQHGLVGYDQMVPMLQALAITGTPTFVRVPWNQPDQIMKALDAGAHGIIVPMVNNAEEARRAVEAAKYPPMGSRSWGPIRAAFELDDYTPEAGNRRTVLAAMIETPEGVRNADEILSTPGIDAAYIGPSDLALGHGMAPVLAVREAEHEQLVRSILDSCRRNGVLAGIHCDSAQTVQRWHDLGFDLASLSSDAVLLREAATAAVRQVTGRAGRAAGAGDYA
ncbi:aldolase/citrate lyase family protein [Saccharopolyspora sp. NPDC050642]|uniref:HpcH/HpaI aldolase family protein n=1 Tax=Saccharopolyspora sp. NPDC050642 TaxID=3157099 RepID=UPI0034044D0E